MGDEEPNIEMSTTIKRGTGTRDEDKHSITARGENTGEALREFKRLKEELVKWAKECRVLQPDEEIEVMIDRLDENGELEDREAVTIDLNEEARGVAELDDMTVKVNPE